MIVTDIYNFKPVHQNGSNFIRSLIDFSIYYLSFRPKHSYVITSQQGLLGHGSMREWRPYENSESVIFMLGLIYIRADYRKFGIGELLTNYLLDKNMKESNLVHANISSEHLPFYIRHGFQASFSLIGLLGRLNEFLDIPPISNRDQIIIRSLENCDLLDLATYDRKIHSVYRIQYFEHLREHIASIAGYVAYSKKTLKIIGYIILNFNQHFIKCGPLFADHLTIALALLKQSAVDYDGTMLLALPEDNRLAFKMFESKSFKKTDLLHRVFKGNRNLFDSNSFERVWAITDDWLSLI